MEPIKLGGLTLKSEPKVEEVEKVVSEEPTGPTPDFNIQEALTSIITRVEELPKSDNLIKALGKLKGALQLLS